MTASKDGASFTNISVEEHFRVSQSNHGGQFVGPTEEFSTAANALIGRSARLTEALKAASINVGYKPVETRDLAAIKEVEARATGESGGSITAVANEAVTRNKKIGKEDENKIHLRDIIAEIDVKITRDRSVTSEDAEAVVQAELTHPPYNHIIPGGVAESVTAAYRLNRSPSL
ncbi:PREDICTED: late embryogenesis abundant protein D-34-like [Brassica oleracea var. oleracea]|uniref:late embryogenesis abundant protein D-34-like n=1 Tax=Brassica oleracea var. oleracea TaxID=109376 RepID=UPI0006A700A2|nr:PREDICTED: late embryogenesis abundant protein D-34-like [Brassica oleracea var. oleracea]